MRSSRLIALFAAATAALATVGAALGTVGAVGATAPPTSEPSLEEAALEFTQCMRDNGIEDFVDPQISADGRIRLRPPDGVGSEELAAAEAVCGHILDEAGWPSDPSGRWRRPSTRRVDRLPLAGSEWEKVVPGGDCVCADGSEFAFWERRADPTKVVFFLDGGGACFDATTCAFTGHPAAERRTTTGASMARIRQPEGGIFDFARPDNPFADYSFIYVPSCTGDVHLGDATREYSPELTVEHNGFVNGTAALNYLAEHYPDAAQVVVVGKTGGSVAAPVYGGLVADLLPDAQVTVFGAQSGHLPDDPDLNAESSVSCGAPLTTCPTGRSTKGSPPATGVPAGSGSRPACTTPTSCWPASTSPTTQKRRRARSRSVSTRRTPRLDRRQRGGDRGSRGGPAQLHRTRRRTHGSSSERNVLRDRGQRRHAGRLGRRADRR